MIFFSIQLPEMYGVGRVNIYLITLTVNVSSWSICLQWWVCDDLPVKFCLMHDRGGLFQFHLVLNFPGRAAYVMFCAIWYRLFNLKTWKTRMEEFYFKKSCRLKSCSFTKLHSFVGVFFTVFSWDQIAQRIAYIKVEKDEPIVVLNVIQD